VGNPFWSPDEEEAHPRRMSMAAWLQPEGGAGEESVQQRRLGLEWCEVPCAAVILKG
jgi:hypothetical protein